MKNGKQAIGLSGYLQIAGCAALLLVLILLLLLVLGMLPLKPVAIATGSMEPVFYAGDIVLVNAAGSGPYTVGDMVQFRKKDYTVVHRIVSFREDADGNRIYTTKGDNNNVSDEDELLDKDVIGKAILVVPKLGRLALLFQK